MFSELTQREEAVAWLIFNGKSNKEAAIMLKLSPRTVEVHRAKIMEKMNVSNTAQLVRALGTMLADRETRPGNGSATRVDSDLVQAADLQSLNSRIERLEQKLKTLTSMLMIDDTGTRLNS